jgi:predicted metal-dependent hydrolase
MKTQGKVASIPYTLERRRSSRLISVRVLGDGTVKVNAPYRVSLAAIERVIVNHQETLRQAIVEQKMHLHTYQNGDSFLFGGVWYALELRQGAKPTIAVNGKSLVVTYCGQEAEPLVVQQLVKELYRTTVKARLEPLVLFWALRLGLPKPPFSVRDSKSRWGSCSAKGRLISRCRCQILDDVQLSYLVLHELAHLVHFNHSKDFHALLALHMDSYKQVQASIFALQMEWLFLF